MFVISHPKIEDLRFPADISKGTTVTIGNFDGVHLGHRQLLSRTIERARETDTVSVALTFDPHPLEILTPYAPPRLTTTETKLALLDQMGIDTALVLRFTKEMASMNPEDFVRRFLVDTLRIKNLILGYDFSLGRGRSGTPEVLASLGEKYGFGVERFSAFSVDDEIVSSTRIRELLRRGQVFEASVLLGRPHCVRGKVVHGQNRGGRLLGFPTANLAPMSEMLPKPGVYATLATPFDGKISSTPFVLKNGNRPEGTCKAVTNVGYNPTFGNSILTIETFLIDFDGDLYDRQLEVSFVDRLRGEITFVGPDALVQQIRKDVAQAQQILS
ncbi:MAG: bifunctional riboflavin kinase/FAD synthetase [Desulfovibrionaceae bacterium]|nr:bifunctional riboflavin kinase/FAD synthetase [Desulfovibrionaceae bacterium]